MNVLLLVLAGVACVGATAAVAWPRRHVRLRAFAALLLANALLFAALGATLAAGAVLLAGAAAAVVLKLLPAQVRRHAVVADGGLAPEPWLAAAAGALLALVVVGTAYHALTVEWRRTLDVQSRRDRNERRLPALPLPESSTDPLPVGRHTTLAALVAAGALLFALGVTGLLSRRGPASMALSAGVMFQGALLTLVAFGALHGNRTGQVFALVVLGVAPVHGAAGLAIAAAVARRGEPPDLAQWCDLRGEHPAVPHDVVGGNADE